MSDFYERFAKRVFRTNLLVLGIGVVTLSLIGSVRMGGSFAVGGVLSWASFHWLQQAVNHLVDTGGMGPVGRRVLVGFLARYALIGLTLFATIRFTILDLTFLLVGLFTYVLAILVECFFEIARVLLKIDSNGRT